MIEWVGFEPLPLMWDANPFAASWSIDNTLRLSHLLCHFVVYRLRLSHLLCSFIICRLNVTFIPPSLPLHGLQITRYVYLTFFCRFMNYRLKVTFISPLPLRGRLRITRYYVYLTFFAVSWSVDYMLHLFHLFGHLRLWLRRSGWREGQ